ncbi:TPA_exp: putative Cyanamide hydratase [Trichophyton benhamiae CBS 112371]|uniref:Cyanamide hydratase, putative n=1 Tax=Arthroderma benhamiae (strain ATCC MYA-4681 / CBS 112371) TaxID=663331 RepID=D4AK51_ARTBC|nr:cyanamide hydratase, putative [Trichophyton benhamiae CBS 112371]EFE37124.1 cyanamide hydratase, putative [Trichophyton benhamiae CBS 112371]DAA79844.1 TPA_exp: putative Cyanamide hydratase [Trichophyton benhamiae CBS 112371]
MPPIPGGPADIFGFTAVDASAEKLFDQIGLRDMPPPPVIPVSATPIPQTILAGRIKGYAKVHLPTPTFHHSMRVYHFGIAMKRYAFPSWAFSDETYFITCMLHDIGTTEDHLRASRMSFELYGGFIAMDLLQYPINEHASTIIDPEKRVTASNALAESVVEAIMRHQDIRDTGKITALGQLIQLATIFGASTFLQHLFRPNLGSMLIFANTEKDNIGGHEQLLSAETVNDVIKHYPRMQWNNCFAATIRKEISLKPWAHSTTLGTDEFPSRIENNPVGLKFESLEKSVDEEGGTTGDVKGMDGK